MGNQDRTYNLDVEDVELIKELFKNNPEYAEFLLEKAKRVKDIMTEMIGDLDIG